MDERVRSFQYFFTSQEFSDGLRTTLSILLPGLLLGMFGDLVDGLTVSLGAVCVSLTDTPGPMVHKRNGMLAATALIGVMALVTGFLHSYPALLGVEVVVCSFVFTMLLVYGNRAGGVGTAGLLIIILMLDRPLKPAEVVPYAGMVVAGGLWYLSVTMLLYTLRPYRPAQQALGDCIRAIADFLRLKAEFYRTGTNLEADYRRLVSQQVTVSEKQDAVRELLFKTRQLVKETTGTGRRLVLTFVDAIDLYEQITITYHDYAALHQRFEATGVLDDIAREIEQHAAELENIGFAIQANHGYTAQQNLLAGLEKLKARIDALDDPARPGHTLMLKKILVNLRNLSQRLQDILAYFDANAPAPSGRELEFGRFVAHQSFDFKQLRDHLTLQSGIFRHSARMFVACLVGYLVTKVLPGHHSYWVIMTITYMLKPAFSLTKERNVQRVLGTLAGGVLGALVLWLIPDRTVLLVLMVLFMLVSYSFVRINYLVTVTFMTPFILILFSFLGLGYVQVVEERVFDTILGCLIAFSTGYLLFPNWESGQLHDYLKAVLRANLHYLRTLQETLVGSPVALVDYKLARKDVYVSSANLGAAFQRMMSEPRGKQHRPTEVHEFVVLNHILSSNVASITSAILAGEMRPGLPAASLKALRQAQQALHRSLRRLDPQEPETVASEPAAPATTAPAAPDAQLSEQLEFIQKVSSDISKVTEAVLK
ncbi:FUSC family protein [Hymenobacter sp. HSC-4F20]|uniref:FUSC family membrane protein n=1 Tax=Hymenobacter sp. HSC-4F20 TaxID=2864135 RepID=UPI001C736886|nr:FUSC family membrane protein [Hymenobacter sp. HSC-4F20]MBX0291136.1 FUSC family protein [Hymenobacter sp. HSC-4F20]